MLDKFALNVGDIPYDWQTLQPEMVFPKLGDCLAGHVASTRLSSSTWMTPLRLCGPLSFTISFTLGRLELREVGTKKRARLFLFTEIQLAQKIYQWIHYTMLVYFIFIAAYCFRTSMNIL